MDDVPFKQQLNVDVGSTPSDAPAALYKLLARCTAIARRYSALNWATFRREVGWAAEPTKVTDPSWVFGMPYRIEDENRLWAAIWFWPRPVGALFNLGVSQVFTVTALGALPFMLTDRPFFPALSLILADYVKWWIEEDIRFISAAITDVDGVNWRLRIELAADPSSRWPDALAFEVTRPFYAAGTGDVDEASDSYVPFAYSKALFEMTLVDSAGTPFAVRFHAKTTPHALDLADSLASKSDGQWTEMKRISNLVVPKQALGEMPGYDLFEVAAAAGSDIQRKARCVWAHEVVGDAITVEIPSVKASYLPKGSGPIRVEPFDAALRSKLKSENQSPATSFRQASFLRRVRQDV